MSQPSPFKTVLSVLISTMMALPTSAWAGDSNPAVARAKNPDATEAVRTFMTDFVDGEGRKGTFFYASIPESQTAQVVAGVMAAKTPDQEVFLQVSDKPRDLVFDSAAWTGRAAEAQVYRVPSDGQYPFLKFKNAAQSFKDKLWRNIVDFTKGCKERRETIMWGVGYAGIQGTYVGFSSGSVAAGVTIATMLSLWNAFITVKPHLWERYISAGGRGGLAAAMTVHRLTGWEMNRGAKRAWQVGGKFAATLAVGFVQAAAVSGSAGNLSGVNLESGLEVLQSSVENNYTILDAWAVRAFSPKGFGNWLKLEWIVGGCLEVLGYMNFGLVPAALTTITALGAVYLATSPAKREELKVSAAKVNFNLRYGVMTISDPQRRGDYVRGAASATGRKLKSTAVSCADRLLGPRGASGEQKVSNWRSIWGGRW